MGELLEIRLLLRDDTRGMELVLIPEDMMEDDSGDVSTLEEREDSSQRHSSIVVMLTDVRGEAELREDVGDDGDVLLDAKLEDCDVLETKDEEDFDESDVLDTKEELDFDDELLVIMEEELDSFELLGEDDID